MYQTMCTPRVPIIAYLRASCTPMHDDNSLVSGVVQMALQDIMCGDAKASPKLNTSMDCLLNLVLGVCRMVGGRRKRREGGEGGSPVPSFVSRASYHT